ncbi:MAG: SpoIIE family protein phosphatase [Planctomycetes bacterium]|nr:SpoIIE family protein phosphatase [Planctomycetota bacterium]
MSDRQTKISKRVPRPSGSNKRPPKSGANKAPAKGAKAPAKAPAKAGKATAKVGGKVGGKSPGKTTAGKTGRAARPKSAKGRTGKIPRVKGKSKKQAAPVAEKDLEPITPFSRGISIGVKFAGLTALVVGSFMGLLGILTYSITSEQMDAQINEQGVSLAHTLEEALDREIWITRPPPEPDPNDPDKIYLKVRTRDEVLAEWKPRLKEIVEGSERRILSIGLIDTAGEAAANLVMAYPTGDRISIRADLDLGSQGNVKITEGTLGQERVRRFERDVSISIFSEEDVHKALGDLAQAEDAGKEEDAKAVRLRIYEGGKIPANEREMLITGSDFETYFGAHPAYQWRGGKVVQPKLWIFVKASRLDAVKKQLKTQIAVVTLCGAVAGILLTVLISAVLTGPVRELEGDITEVASGNMDHQSHVTSTDEIGALAHVFNIMARNLKIAQENAVERKAIERELNIAKEIQEKLLPERIPQIPGLDIHSFYNSAKEVGGDYYDFIVIDQAHLGIIVADVAGKGIPGAMVMTMARSLVRLASVRNVSPGDTFKKVNRILAKDIRRGMFVTSAYMVLNVKTKTLKVASAGHNPVVLYRAKTGENELLKPKGIALGFDKGTIFDNNIAEIEVQLEPGDRLVTYTDGVNEAMNNESEEFGDDRFYTLVKEHARKSSKEFVEALVTELDAHRGDAEQSDDITIVTLSVIGGPQ